MDRLSGITKTFIQKGFISEESAIEATKLSNSSGESLIDVILNQKEVSSMKMASFLSGLLGYPVFDLDFFNKNSVPEELLKMQCFQDQEKCFPLAKRDNLLLLAVYDPTDNNIVKEVAFQTSMHVHLVVVEYAKLKRLCSQLDDDAVDSGITDEEAMEMLFIAEQDAEKESQEASQDEVDEAPVVRFIQKIILNAIKQGASDIHFEPYEHTYRVRFRVDGVLKEVATPPPSVKDTISSRIKVISRLDISEKRLPQDGRSKIRVSSSKEVDIRVSVLPTLHGEKIVVRILDNSAATLNIDVLGYEDEQKKLLVEAIERPYGMVLVTGPTGSGKTVSLYTCLNILNDDGSNISTAEDPAEINFPGINQVNVNPKIGLTFSSALKSFLRQDPDIIMLGEIRDLETAEIAIKAAQTGHLVLSTLHTNDAPGTLVRLMNIGIPAYNIVSTVHLITAQRLVRRLCTCKKSLTVPKNILLEAGYEESEVEGLELFGPGGCDTCGYSGYKGRLGVYQVMPISEAMEKIILKGGSAMDIAKQAKDEGINDLRRSGLIKVARGETSLEEVLGATNL